MALSELDINTITKLVGQETAQQISEQINQASAQGNLQGTQDEKTYSSDQTNNDVLGAELLKASNAKYESAMAINMKSLIEDSRDFDRRLKNDGINLQSSLNHVHLSALSNAQVMNNYIQYKLLSQGNGTLAMESIKDTQEGALKGLNDNAEIRRQLADLGKAVALLAAKK